MKQENSEIGKKVLTDGLDHIIQISRGVWSFSERKLARFYKTFA